MNSDGYAIDSTFSNGAETNSITALDSSATITLGDNEINLVADIININGAPIGGLTNPLTADLDAAGYSINNITNVNTNKLVITNVLPISNAIELIGKVRHDSPSIPVIYDMNCKRPGGVFDSDYIAYGNYSSFNDANALGLVARVGVRVNGNHTATNRGCDYVIQSTLSNEILTVERLKIAADGITYISGGLDITDDLNINSSNIINIGVAGYNLESTLLDLSNKTQNIGAVAGFTEISGGVNQKLSAGKSFNISDDGSPFALLKFNVNNTDILSQIKHVFSVGLEPAVNIVGSIGTTLKRFNTLWVNSINGLTPSGGVYSGLSDSLQCTQANSPCSLLPSTGTGSLSVPGNTFTVGAQYHIICSGEIPAQSSSDIVTITLKANSTPLGLISVDMENVTGVRFFELEGDFSFRTVGANAEIVTSFEFSFNRSIDKDFRGTRSISQSTIDSTVTQTIGLDASISGATTSLITKLFLIRRQY